MNLPRTTKTHTDIKETGINIEKIKPRGGTKGKKNKPSKR